MRIFTLNADLWLAASLDEVFRFFGDAGNLERITPPMLGFHVLTPRPIEMHVGTLIDYRIRIHGFPVRWQSRVTVWDPPHRFVDEQVRGPYRKWVHEHTFEASDGGTLASDHVEYAVPGGALVNSLLVRRDLKRIFDFRREKMLEIFPLSSRHAP